MASCGTLGVLVVQMGGTIDKDYPRQTCGYAFEIGSSAARRILTRINPPLAIRYATVCRKDSQDMDDTDRHTLWELCEAAPEHNILITHGTDTILDTARYLLKGKLNKTIILTGSFKPEAFKSSDADFNIGMSLGALQTCGKPGVYVCMNGLVLPADKTVRHPTSHQFILHQ